MQLMPRHSCLGWYDREINKYDWDNPRYTTATGHFSQVFAPSRLPLPCPRPCPCSPLCRCPPPQGRRVACCAQRLYKTVPKLHSSA